MPKKPQDDDGFPTSAELSQVDEDEPSAHPAPPASNLPSMLEKIEQLKELREAGVITDEEYEKMVEEFLRDYSS
jgi:Short C-terminal domain